jgi:hypothetical protein
MSGSGGWRGPNVKVESNLYFDTSGAPMKFEALTLAEWQATGKDTRSLITDPKFVDAEHFDFRLRPGSPACQIGFRPFDFSKAGVYGDAAWIRKAGEIKYPPMPKNN